jgi:Bacteriocin-protection, YdeI or OmpD-Associated/Domain of unknown function (DUF1905)
VVRFTVELLPAPLGTFVEIPAEVVAALRVTGRTSVIGTIDGQPFRNQFMPYLVEGRGKTVMMVVNKAVRTSLGKSNGDTVEFELERDDRSRSADVEVPGELAAALAADRAATAAWDALAPSHRREYAEHVAEGKKSETRERRAAKTVETLRG